MRGAVHHVDLTVKDAHASRPFYESVLGFMGYRYAGPMGDSGEPPHGHDFERREGDQITYVGILTARGENAARAHDRYSVGLHHLAWTAESRADVDAMYAHLQSIGATILDPPADYPEYGPGYYAVFFADPDGLKLEYVYKP